MKIGDSVYTPRFCTVRIAAVFENEAEARAAGFAEPPSDPGDYNLLGKSLNMYRMEFAAVSKGASYA